MKKMLLHSCCGPCSTHVIDTLSDDYEITVYYYNPNILPDTEYIKRRTEQERFIKEYSEKTGKKIDYIEGDYEPDFFLSIIKGYEHDKEGGHRCEICIKNRLEKTCEKAKVSGFDIFCSTLSVSPHKNAAYINEIGKMLSEKYQIEYLISDFKKKDGYKHSIEMSKEYSLYRQNYCGCGLS